jgi:hypothetical protein
MPPLAVRVKVAERQLARMLPRAFGDDGVYTYLKPDWSLARRLQWLLGRIFEDGENVAPHALDHDPALILRPYNPRIKDVAARYTPHAHDPAALVYRAKADHQQKTTGRKPGAEHTATTKGSDIGLAAKFRRLERRQANRKVRGKPAVRKPRKAKPRLKHSQRPKSGRWPKQSRKIANRGFRK